MKLSVSLREEDVEFLDSYVAAAAAASRSGAVQDAIELLRVAQLEAAYAEAWDEWAPGTDAELWESVGADGVDPVPAPAG